MSPILNNCILIENHFYMKTYGCMSYTLKMFCSNTCTGWAMWKCALIIYLLNVGWIMYARKCTHEFWLTPFSHLNHVVSYLALKVIQLSVCYLPVFTVLVILRLKLDLLAQNKATTSGIRKFLTALLCCSWHC